jgi:3-dehydroquinate dehydratase/shikimate dehydrogenase
MICVPIAPESRTLARADLLNAARVADLVELGLDRFLNPPDVASLIAGVGKPVIVSCRRKKDGGHFVGKEEDRLALLREAIAADPAFIELELDIAARLPRTGKARRIVSINRPFRAITDAQEQVEKAASAGADVVKFVWPGVLLDSLEPVLTAMQKATRLKIVGVPIGSAGRAFPVLARRLGAPWVYAALERGMETHDGLPSLTELDELYDIRHVNGETKLTGAAGFGVVRERTLRAFNAGFRELGVNGRCLPLEIGPVESLAALLDQLEIAALVVSPGMGDYLFGMVQYPEPAVALGHHVDLLLRKPDGWHGYNVLWRSVLKVIERTLKRSGHEPKNVEQANNLILGAGRSARTMLFGLRQLKATGAITVPGGRDEVAFCPHCGEAQDTSSTTIDLAKSLDARHVSFADVLSTRPDVLIVTDPAVELGFQPNTLNPMFLQAPLVVADVTTLFHESDILIEARDRGCTVVRPRYVLGEHLAAQFKAVAGEELPDAAFQQTLEMGG